MEPELVGQAGGAHQQVVRDARVFEEPLPGGVEHEGELIVPPVEVVGGLGNLSEHGVGHQVEEVALGGDIVV